MKSTHIEIVVPEWDHLRDKDGLPDFPAPANINEMCLIDRARLRESMKRRRLEMFCYILCTAMVILSYALGVIVGMAAQ